MFGRGFKVLTLFGIPVYLDVSFFLIVPLFSWIIANNLGVYAQLTGLEQEAAEVFDLREASRPSGTADAPAPAPGVGRPGLALLFGVLVTLGLYASVLVHEFGHALTARLYNVPTERVTLWFLGGIASFERIPRQPGAEAIVAIAGPLTSYAIAFGLWFIAIATSQDAHLWQLVIRTLAIINFILATFNLLPALPLDGGRVLRSLLALALPYMRATQIAAVISKVLAAALFIYAVLPPGIEVMLIVVAAFIWLAVNAETRQSAIEELLKGVRVDDVMVRDVMTVRPDMPSGLLLEEMIRRRHVGFPVVDDSGKVLGVIGLREFQEGFEPNQAVGSLMRTDFCSVPTGTEAMRAFERMGQNDFSRCLVVDEHQRLKGLVSKSDLMRLMRVRAAALTAASRRMPELGFER
jgi:Zn-dependent protease/CBS domain-containing protein